MKRVVGNCVDAHGDGCDVCELYTKEPIPGCSCNTPNTNCECDVDDLNNQRC